MCHAVHAVDDVFAMIRCSLSIGRPLQLSADGVRVAIGRHLQRSADGVRVAGHDDWNMLVIVDWRSAALLTECWTAIKKSLLRAELNVIVTPALSKAIL